jgi:hypothetical protein
MAARKKATRREKPETETVEVVLVRHIPRARRRWQNRDGLSVRVRYGQTSIVPRALVEEYPDAFVSPEEFAATGHGQPRPFTMEMKKDGELNPTADEAEDSDNEDNQPGE